MNIVHKFLHNEGIITEHQTNLFFEMNRINPWIAIDNDKMVGYLTESKLRCIQNDYDIGYKNEDNIQDIFAYLEMNNYIENDTRKKYGIMAKPGKIFKKLLPNLSDSDISNLVSKWYASIVTDSRVFVLDNNFSYGYDPDNYYSENGNLGSSCMRHYPDRVENFYSCFDCNILTLQDEDEKIHGRAIVWNSMKFKGDRENGDNITVEIPLMDRVYVNDDKDIEKFIQYARQNNIAYKEKQSYSQKQSFFIPFDDKYEFCDCVHCKIVGNDIPEYLPYLDTMTWLDIDDITLYNHDTGFYTHELTETDCPAPENSQTIIYNGDRYNIEDCIYLDSECEYIPLDFVIMCDHCHEYILKEYAIEAQDEYIYFCDNNCANMANYYECEEGGGFYHIDYMCEIDGFLYHQDLCSYCDITEENYLTDDSVHSKLYSVDIDGHEAIYSPIQDTYLYTNNTNYEYKDLCVNVNGEKWSVCIYANEDEEVITKQGRYVSIERLNEKNVLNLLNFDGLKYIPGICNKINK